MAVLDIKTPRFFLPIVSGKHRYAGIYGGRASGKSHQVAEWLIERSIDSKLDIVCLREVQKSLEFSVKKLLEQKIETFNAGSYFEVQDRRILTKAGGIFIFEGMQQHTSNSIKSLESFDIAWCEEAQTLSQTSLDILRPTLRKETSELIFTWNPTHATDPVDKFLRSATPYPDSLVVSANYMDNPFLPEVMRQEMEYDRQHDYDKYSHIWLGQYQKHSQARVFKNWSVAEFDTPADVTFRFGADWGFASDPSVLVRAYLVGNTLYIDQEAYGLNVEIVDLPELFSKVPESTKWPITADSSRPETVSYMRNHGYPHIRSAIKGANSIEEGITFLKSFTIVVHPRCKHVIDELTSYKYKTDRLTQEILPVLEDTHNHLIDSLRYALEGLRKAMYPTPIGIQIASL